MADIRRIETHLEYDGHGAAVIGTEGVQPVKTVGLSALGANPGAWGPPHLFVAGVEACFYATLVAVLNKARVGLASYRSRAVGEMGSPDGKHTEITLITLFIEAQPLSGDEGEKLRHLIEKAKEYCLVARSVRCPIGLEIKIV